MKPPPPPSPVARPVWSLAEPCRGAARGQCCGFACPGLSRGRDVTVHRRRLCPQTAIATRGALPGLIAEASASALAAARAVFFQALVGQLRGNFWRARAACRARVCRAPRLRPGGLQMGREGGLGRPEVDVPSEAEATLISSSGKRATSVRRGDWVS